MSKPRVRVQCRTIPMLRLVEKSEVAPNADIAALIEALREHNESGELVGVAVAMVFDGDYFATPIAGRFGFAMMRGVVRELDDALVRNRQRVSG